MIATDNDDLRLARARQERHAAWTVATQRLRHGVEDPQGVVWDLRTAYARAWQRWERPVLERKRRVNTTYLNRHQRGNA